MRDTASQTGAAPAPATGLRGYLAELAVNWRPLLATLIGLGTGFSFNQYVTSIMAPHMLAEFGWSRSEFAAVGGLSLIMSFVFPFVGRLNDVLGVRRTALIGVIALPLAYLALGAQNGDLRVYMGLFVFQAAVCITTTATVFTRVVVQYIERARGLALAIVASGPALFGAILAPLLNDYVEVNGWRQGYFALAAFTATAGAIALLMLPPSKRDAARTTSPAQRTKQDYTEIFSSKAFWILLAALFLCNLPQVIALTQMSLLLVENGISTANVSAYFSIFATGTLIGRFLCGLALDRFPVHIVSAIGMGLPSIGLALIASDIDTPLALSTAIFLFALSLGAEGDLVGYLVVRTFGVRIYSSVMGLMTAAISTSASAGALLLGYTLGVTETFGLFLIVCCVTVTVGALMFLALNKPAAQEPQSGPA